MTCQDHRNTLLSGDNLEGRSAVSCRVSLRVKTFNVVRTGGHVARPRSWVDVLRPDAQKGKLPHVTHVTWIQASKFEINDTESVLLNTLRYNIYRHDSVFGISESQKSVVVVVVCTETLSCVGSERGIGPGGGDEGGDVGKDIGVMSEFR